MRRLVALWLVLLLAALVGVVGPLPANEAAAGPAQAQTSRTARASVDGTELGWGDRTTVRASGFAPGQTVFVVLYPNATELFRGEADAGGSVSGTITVPTGLASSTAYQLVVQGVGADGLLAYLALPLTILGPTPSVSMSSTELSWLEQVTVRGERYQPGAKITVSLFPDNLVLGEATADGAGRFAVEVTIPDQLRSATDYQVAVTGAGIDQLFHFDTIEVAIIGDRPAIFLDRDQVPRGGSLTISGQPFHVGTDVTIVLLPGFEVLAEVPVEADGTFTATVRIPEDAFAADPHQIVVTGMGADGIFAYAAELISLGDAPAGGATGSTVATLPVDGSVTSPRFDRFVDRYLPPVPGPPRRGAGGVPGWLLLVIVLVLLLLLVATRKDVRRAARRRLTRR